MNELIKQRIEESIKAKESILNDEKKIAQINQLAEVICEKIKKGNKVFICGNGGSASDAMHIAGEFVGRFQKERKAWPVLALGCDTVAMTAVSNDYCYEEVYRRQVEAFLNKGDLLIGISTSGNSRNILYAIEKAKELGGDTAALLGKNGGTIKNAVDLGIIVPNDVTARIQECHIMIGHILCELVEERLANVE